MRRATGVSVLPARLLPLLLLLAHGNASAAGGRSAQRTSIRQKVRQTTSSVGTRARAKLPRKARKQAASSGCMQGCLLLAFARGDRSPDISVEAAAAQLAELKSRLADPVASAREAELLGMLGITRENSKASPLDWSHSQLQNGAPIGKTTDAAGRPTGKLPLSELRRRPFINRRLVLDTPEARNAASAMGFLLSYDPHLSAAQASEPRYQRRLTDLFAKARSVLREEMGTEFADYVPGFAVVQGGPFSDSLNAVTLPNGSILVHKKTIEVADMLGASLATAATRQDVLRAWVGMTVGGGRTRPGGRALRDPQALGDAVLAKVAYHEVGHALGQHGASGIILPTAKEAAAGRSARGIQAKETVSDIKAMELAIRAGHSPLGAASFMAAMSFVELYAGSLKYDPQAGAFQKSPADHPSALDRYTRTYKTLQRMRDGRRRVYVRSQRTEGRPYMTEQQRQDFDLLPTPAELESKLVEVLQSVNRSPMTDSLLSLADRLRRRGSSRTDDSVSVARPPASGRPPVVIRGRRGADAWVPPVLGFPTDGTRYLGKSQVKRVLETIDAP